MARRERFSRDGTRRRDTHDPARAPFGPLPRDPRPMINRNPVPPPVECACALLIPPFDGADTSPYMDYATASAIVGSSQVSNCIGFVQLISGGLLTSFTADDTTPDEVTLSIVGNPDNAPGCQAETWGGVNMKAGSTLTVSISIGNFLSATVKLFSCSGTLLDEQTGAGPLTFSVPSDGVYVVKCLGVSSTPGFMGGSDTFDFTLSSDDTMSPNPVIALWDDSGTTRQLEACPKMLLPPLTESTGDWYADEAAAQAAIDDLTSNCVGVTDPDADILTFDATDGGTSLELDWTSNPLDSVTGYGSVNAEAGETLTLTWAGTGASDGTLVIRDYLGNVVEETSGSSPVVSSALPHTGRYIVTVNIDGGGMTAATGTVTSSGALSVNPIQALYDTGLTCPARLDCS